MAADADPRPGCERRQSARRKVLLPGDLETTATALKVVLLDCSRTGAMIETPKAPPIGSDVILRSGPIDVLGRVAWFDGQRCGLELEEIISEAQVVALAKLPPGEALLSRRFGSQGRDEAEAAAEEWARPTGSRASLD